MKRCCGGQSEGAVAADCVKYHGRGIWQSVGGVLVDFAGIKAMLATGLGLSMIGTAIVCIFVSRKDN